MHWLQESAAALSRRRGTALRLDVAHHGRRYDERLWAGANAIVDLLAANYEKITIRVPKGTKDEIKQWADACGMSMAQYIRQACAEKAERIPS
jgi:hypothetical protein